MSNNDIANILQAIAIAALAFCSIYDGYKIRKLTTRIDDLEDQVKRSNTYQGIPKEMPH